jgi:hypothetical protein
MRFSQFMLQSVQIMGATNYRDALDVATGRERRRGLSRSAKNIFGSFLPSLLDTPDLPTNSTPAAHNMLRAIYHFTLA